MSRAEESAGKRDRTDMNTRQHVPVGDIGQQMIHVTRAVEVFDEDRDIIVGIGTRVASGP